MELSRTNTTHCNNRVGTLLMSPPSSSFAEQNQLADDRLDVGWSLGEDREDPQFPGEGYQARKGSIESNLISFCGAGVRGVGRGVGKGPMHVCHVSRMCQLTYAKPPGGGKTRRTGKTPENSKITSTVGLLHCFLSYLRSYLCTYVTATHLHVRAFFY